MYSYFLTAIETTSSDTTLRNNLVSEVIWEGDFQGRAESTNLNYHGAIKGLKAIRLTMTGNTVAGAQRIAFQVVGQSCGVTDNIYEDNQAHSSLICLGVLAKDVLGGDSTCQQFTDFSCWRNYDFGAYLNNIPSFIVKGGVFTENVIGIFSMVAGPSALAHQYQNKFVEVRNVTFIGRTSSFSCSKNQRRTNINNIRFSSLGRTFNNAKGNHYGMTFTNFQQGGNNSPEKPFTNIMAYPAIMGIVRLIGKLANHR